MTSLNEIGGISINVMCDPNEKLLIVGDLEGYDDIRDALNMALQSLKTHPEEEYRINHIHDKWKVARVKK